MKKRFFLIGAIAIFGLGAFLVSCEKKTCVCTTYDIVSQSTLQKDLDNALKSLSLFDDCSDLESKMMSSYGYHTMDCK